MNKILEFLKSHMIIVKWTIWYFFMMWFILKFVFQFDMLSVNYWWKFFHATLHGFSGFIFGSLVYAMIPLYIATTIIVRKKQEMIIPVPFTKTFQKIISKIFQNKSEPETPQKSETQEQQIINENTEPEFPSDLPPELRVPFQRAKNRLPLTGAISVYNKPHTPKQPEAPATETITSDSTIPIPTDFDVSEDFSNMSDSVPHFTDIDFDVPIATEQETENNTTKYLSKHNIEYETYRDFVATEKFVIYEHNDEDFWIMEDDSWFASGKQKDSPISELISLAKQNELTPVLYLHSKNIMDIENTIAKIESSGVRVIKDLDELK